MESVIKLISIIILFALSYWVARDASIRKMNAKVWAVLVLLFSIIVLPIYFIVRKPKMESSNHYKNGAFPKSHTSRLNSKSKTMRVMSIIGIVFFSLCLFLMIVFWGEEPSDDEAAAGIALWGILYAIALAIVGVVSTTKKSKPQQFDLANELNKLATLKEKGVITEDEFNQRKALILNNE